MTEEQCVVCLTKKFDCLKYEGMYICKKDFPDFFSSIQTKLVLKINSGESLNNLLENQLPKISKVLYQSDNEAAVKCLEFLKDKEGAFKYEQIYLQQLKEKENEFKKMYQSTNKIEDIEVFGSQIEIARYLGSVFHCSNCAYPMAAIEACIHCTCSNPFCKTKQCFCCHKTIDKCEIMNGCDNYSPYIYENYGFPRSPASDSIDHEVHVEVVNHFWNARRKEYYISLVLALWYRKLNFEEDDDDQFVFFLLLAKKKLKPELFEDIFDYDTSIKHNLRHISFPTVETHVDYPVLGKSNNPVSQIKVNNKEAIRFWRLMRTEYKFSYQYCDDPQPISNLNIMKKLLPLKNYEILDLLAKNNQSPLKSYNEFYHIEEADDIFEEAEEAEEEAEQFEDDLIEEDVDLLEIPEDKKIYHVVDGFNHDFNPNGKFIFERIGNSYPVYVNESNPDIKMKYNIRKREWQIVSENMLRRLIHCYYIKSEEKFPPTDVSWFYSNTFESLALPNENYEENYIFVISDEFHNNSRFYFDLVLERLTNIPYTSRSFGFNEHVYITQSNQAEPYPYEKMLGTVLNSSGVNVEVMLSNNQIHNFHEDMLSKSPFPYLKFLESHLIIIETNHTELAGVCYLVGKYNGAPLFKSSKGVILYLESRIWKISLGSFEHPVYRKIFRDDESFEHDLSIAGENINLKNRIVNNLHYLKPYIGKYYICNGDPTMSESVTVNLVAKDKIAEYVKNMVINTDNENHLLSQIKKEQIVVQPSDIGNFAHFNDYIDEQLSEEDKAAIPDCKYPCGKIIKYIIDDLGKNYVEIAFDYKKEQVVKLPADLCFKGQYLEGFIPRKINVLTVIFVDTPVHKYRGYYKYEEIARPPLDPKPIFRKIDGNSFTENESIIINYQGWCITTDNNIDDIKNWAYKAIDTDLPLPPEGGSIWYPRHIEGIKPFVKWIQVYSLDHLNPLDEYFD